MTSCYGNSGNRDKKQYIELICALRDKSKVTVESGKVGSMAGQNILFDYY